MTQILHLHIFFALFVFYVIASDDDSTLHNGTMDSQNVAGENSTGFDLCASHNRVIYPTTGTTIDGKELFILNTREHRQGIRISVCANNGASCLGTCKNSSYRTQCEQGYIYHELMAMSHEGMFIKKEFQFPAFCTCKIFYNNTLNSNEKTDERLAQNWKLRGKRRNLR